MSKTFKILAALCILSGLGMVNNQHQANNLTINQPAAAESGKQSAASFPLDIELLRKREYPGGDFVIEKTLPMGANYRQFIASYLSEGLKIYGLVTIPTSPKPQNGYPAILFVHGYIPPKKYSTTKNYPTYQAALAKNGFITFKPDLRGHGNSEGEAVSAHYSEKYLVDVMCALSYLKIYKETDAKRIGYWGHSNGGEIGLRALVISSDIKAASFWAGVVGSYPDMLETYNSKIPFLKNENNPLIKEYGLPSKNPNFWKRIDPYSFLNYISAPIQLQHGTADASVPIELSLHLKKELEKLKKEVEYYEYIGDNHNLSNNSQIAWQKTITFFQEKL